MTVYTQSDGSITLYLGPIETLKEALISEVMEYDFMNPKSEEEIKEVVEKTLEEIKNLDEDRFVECAGFEWSFTNMNEEEFYSLPEFEGW